MSEETSEAFKALGQFGQYKRARNRASSTALLEDAGLDFESKNDGAHLVVRSSRGYVVDFWPGTGLWIVRGEGARRRGVRNLLTFFWSVNQQP